MKIISEKEFEECIAQQIAAPVRVCFTNEDRPPLYIFIDKKEQNIILKEAFKDSVTQFLKEQLISFEKVKIELFPFNLNITNK